MDILKHPKMIAMESNHNLLVTQFVNAESKFQRLIELRDNVRMHGVSILAMESLATLCPEAINDAAPIKTFTMKPSQVNMQYANENFFTALGKAFVWIITKIFDIIMAIINGIMSMLDWIFTSGDKDGGNLKDAGKLIKDKDKILKEFTDVKKEFEAKVSDMEKANTFIISEQSLKMMHAKFNTQLDNDINEGREGYTIRDVQATMDALLIMQMKTTEAIAGIIDNIERMMETGVHGEALGDLVFNIWKDFTIQNLVLLPYSYSITLDTILDEGGRLPMEWSDVKHRDKFPVVLYLNDMDKENNAFWEGYAANAAGHQATKILWDAGANKVYSKGLDIPFSTTLKLDYISDNAVTIQAAAKLKYEKKMEDYQRSAKKHQDKYESFSKSFANLAKEREQCWAKDESYEPDAMVWPERKFGIPNGQVPENVNMDNASDKYYRALNFPDIIINNGVFTKMMDSIVFQRDVFKDILLVLRRHIDHVDTYGKYLKDVNRDIENMIAKTKKA